MNKLIDVLYDDFASWFERMPSLEGSLVLPFGIHSGTLAEDQSLGSSNNVCYLCSWTKYLIHIHTASASDFLGTESQFWKVK